MSPNTHVGTPKSIPVTNRCSMRGILPAHAEKGSATESVRSRADLSRPGHHVLRARHLGQRHRPAGVQLLGRDPYLRAESELATVGEAAAGVDEDDCRVDLGDEPLSRCEVTGDDRLRVAVSYTHLRAHETPEHL